MEAGNIVLIGFMGSGKSTVSRRLARRLHWDVVDTDRLVEEQAGLGIPDIFASVGEAGFRELETRVIAGLRAVRRTVVATGGGVILSGENRRLLRELGFTVWLTASPDVLFERVSRNSDRPLLQSANPRETLDRLLEERRQRYTEVADCVVDSTHLSHRAVVDLITARAGQYFGWERVGSG